jgi:hypothetical protein
MIQVYPGERRLLAAELAAAMTSGDALVGTPDVVSLAPHITVAESPAPAIVGTQVRFWVDVGATAKPAHVSVKVTCSTANAETIVEPVPLQVGPLK